jgi:hypothetical protein
MINFTIFRSLKNTIEQTLNKTLKDLINKELVIISKSNKLDLKISFTPNSEVRTLTVKLDEL